MFHVHVLKREKLLRARGERLLYFDFIQERMELYIKDEPVVVVDLMKKNEDAGQKTCIIRDVKIVDSHRNRGFGISFLIPLKSKSTGASSSSESGELLTLFTLTSDERTHLQRILLAYSAFNSQSDGESPSEKLHVILDDADLPPASVKKGFVFKRGTSGAITFSFRKCISW